jgi:hypothetical protein
MGRRDALAGRTVPGPFRALTLRVTAHPKVEGWKVVVPRLFMVALGAGYFGLCAAPIAVVFGIPRMAGGSA